MTFETFVAHRLMQAVGILSPANKHEWRMAMETEFETFADGPGALGWAAGCLGAAAGWRFQAEFAFLASLAAAIVLAGWITTLLFLAIAEPSDGGGFVWISMFALAQQIAQGLICFALAAIWHRRAVIIGLFVPLAASGGAMSGFLLSILFRDGAGFPALQAVGDGAAFLGAEIWPSLLGAALGALVTRLRLRGSRA